MKTIIAHVCCVLYAFTQPRIERGNRRHLQRKSATTRAFQRNEILSNKTRLEQEERTRRTKYLLTTPAKFRLCRGN